MIDFCTSSVLKFWINKFFVSKKNTYQPKFTADIIKKNSVF